MGVLAGRYKTSDAAPEGSRVARIGAWAAERVTQQSIKAAQEVAEVARDRGMTSSQLALLWVKDQPAVTSPIIGPRTEAHLEDAIAVLEMSLDNETAAAMDDIVPPGTAIADFHNTSGWMRMHVGD
jgi:aryl-alcohol dehydrogenase-like predicted oxidoreductase